MRGPIRSKVLKSHVESHHRAPRPSRRSPPPRRGRLRPVTFDFPTFDPNFPMQLARIDGIITSTACHPSMRKGRAVICQPLDAEGRPDGAPVLALDQLGAGLHQIVFFSTDGSETRKLVADERSPLRNHVQAIVDPSRPSSTGSE